MKISKDARDLWGNESEFGDILGDELGQHGGDFENELMAGGGDYIDSSDVHFTIDSVDFDGDECTAGGNVYYSTKTVTSCDQIQHTGEATATVTAKVNRKTREVTVSFDDFEDRTRYD